MRLLLPCLVILLMGCTEEEAPPPAPLTGGGLPGVGGIGDPRDDAGTVDGALPDAESLAPVPGCAEVASGSTANRALLTLDGETIDFEPRSAAAFHEPVQCTEASVFALVLSADDSCRTFDAPLLVARVLGAAVDVTVPAGVSLDLSLVEAGAAGIDVGFDITVVVPGPVRTTTYAARCGASVGFVVFEELVDGPGLQILEIDGTLPNCEDPSLPPLNVVARVTATQETSFETSCQE
ncbi:MAG: hypothetical protein AAF938_18940 [Myxococcota bacterium]